MKILILGGTGAIGISLVQKLSNTKNEVYVTSRIDRNSSSKNIHYIKGNAKDLLFIKKLLRHNDYDVIIDFMVYQTYEFLDRVYIFLNATKHYFFFSSCRVFDNTSDKINENSNRLLDTSNDSTYLSTDEYALSKARQENILKHSNSNNYTIIRPYITFNSNRLQLGVYEKENWLYRALNKRTIVISKEILDKYTTITYSKHVAEAIIKLMLNRESYGKSYNVTTSEYIRWSDVLFCYVEVIKKKYGFIPTIKIVENKEIIRIWNNEYQIKYDRMFDRIFDCSLINKICDMNCTNTKNELKECLEVFLEQQKFSTINWKCEALMDRISHETTNLEEINGKKNKLIYIFNRFVKINLKDMV